MSLNKFTDVQKGVDLKLNIGCELLKTMVIETDDAKITNAEFDTVGVVDTLITNNLSVGAEPFETKFPNTWGADGSVIMANGIGVNEYRYIPKFTIGASLPAVADVAEGDLIASNAFGYGSLNLKSDLRDIVAGRSYTFDFYGLVLNNGAGDTTFTVEAHLDGVLMLSTGLFGQSSSGVTRPFKCEFNIDFRSTTEVSGFSLITSVIGIGINAENQMNVVGNSAVDTSGSCDLSIVVKWTVPSAARIIQVVGGNLTQRSIL